MSASGRNDFLKEESVEMELVFEVSIGRLKAKICGLDLGGFAGHLAEQVADF